MTAVGAGATTITATSETKTGTSSITVTLAPVNTVTVTPSSASLVVGITPTQQLTATLRDAANNVLTGRVVTWTSSNTAAATVDGNGLVTAVGAGATTITATSETKTGTSSITVTVAPVNTVTVTPSSASLVLGITSTQQLTATLRDAANNVLTGRVVTWTSSNTAAATVDASGLVTAVGAGATTITATSETKTGTSSITVTLAPVNTVTVTPSSASLVVGITPTQQLTATLRDAANNVLTGRVVTWTSSNAAAATVDGNGLVTAVGAGATTITATSETKTGTSSITVTVAPVNTVTVTPSSASLVLGITSTQQLTATPRDAVNNVLTGRLVTWTSSNTAAATVDASGLVTAVGAGATTITATSETKTGTSSITVTLAPVNTVTVTPSSASLVVGITPTQQLTATLRDAANNVLSGRVVTWTSSNAAAATVDANGLVTAVAAGVTTITATSETKTGTSSVTVTLAPVNTVTVAPATAGLVLGVTPTQQLAATLRDAANNVLTGRVVTWTSSNTAAATVDASGLVTAVGAGATTITATSETKTGTSSITVTLAPVNTVTVTPSSASLVVGITPTQQLTATLRDAANNVLTGRVVTWTSSNAAAATVDGNGLVTAVGAGATTITATSETKTGTSSITVTVAPVNTVTVTPSSASLVLGITSTQQLTATPRDAVNNVLTGRLVTWTSSNTAAATVDASGLVTAVGAGATTITATSETKTGTSSITVTLAPVNTVTVTPSSASLVVGITPTQQLTATLRDAANNVLSGRVVTWTSSNTAAATVDASGLVTAVAAGATTITATSETKTGTSSITVTLAPVNTVTVAPATAGLVLGVTPTQQLAATLRDAANNVLSGRVVTWTSSNTAAATVDASGLVTAVGAGATTITATSETKTGTSSITVTLAPVNTVTVTPSSASLVVGITPTQQLTATLRDAANNVLTGRVVTWTSSNTAAATVDGNGLVTAVGAGATTITATSETKTGTSSITVTVAPVNTVTVTPSSASLVLGITSTQQLTATLRDAANNVLTGRVVTWTSSNTAAATVDASGLVTAVGAGATTITATSETKTGTSSITVTLAPVNTVTVTPASANLVLGVTPTQQLTAVTKDANGSVLTGRLVTWTSSNTAAATVDANGLVTAVGAGSTTITATSETKTGTSSITVTLAPVSTVTLSTPTTPMVAGGTQMLTALPKDVNNNILSGRTVSWVSSNPAVLSVSVASSVSTGSGATVTVSAVGLGTATITATSESVSSGPTPTITVNQAPVATVTVSVPSTPTLVGGTQQLTAVTKDANGNVLTGRTVTWLSSNTSVLTVSPSGSPATVTGVAVGTATITATSESVTSSPTPTITVNPMLASGPLRASTVNPRYFADPTGRVVYLTGSEYWNTIEDNGPSNPPPVFDYSAFLDFLQSHNHNFTRLFMWEQARWSSLSTIDHWFSPNLYVRTGPGIGIDSAPKFDLTQINPAYLARVRQRVIDAGARGIYVSVMLFNGWAVEFKAGTGKNPWLSHPFNAANNINNINGDPNSDQSGQEIQTLSIPVVTALQDTYVRAVIDAVNDLDNVIYEISNETNSNPAADAWQYHMINLIRSYEAGKPKQHPIGMTVPWPSGSNSEVLNSTADWVAMNGDLNNPPAADGSKVSLWDTDHLCGICGDMAWPWRSLTRGHNTLLMDGYNGAPGYTDPAYDPTDPKWEVIRKNMGYARSYALRMDLANARPRSDLASSSFCLAVVGSEYLVFNAEIGNVSVNLSGVSGSRTVEWLNPATGQTTAGGTVTGGGSVSFTPPFSGMAVLYIHP